ncbi:nitroreductase/quinone reductase family protein [Mycolicibacterium celeriflavum]|uniref:nitroreductase/quinone reductase family protein n=1 Tax=Mycolicibacterium celeriflavum TaxID=1249101 RepID=UPI003CF84485
MDTRRLLDAIHRRVNPFAQRIQSQAVVETTGRVSGKPHRTPVSGRLEGRTFWFVSMNGESADYVRNIKAHNAVRLRIDGRWRTGRAYPMPDDDAHARNARLPGLGGLVNRAFGTDLLTIRVDIDG